MSISYPLSVPATPKIRDIKITLRNVVGETESPTSLRQQQYRWSGCRWEFDVHLPTMNRANAALWQAFLASLKGKYGTFLLGDPDALTPQGVATGTPLVSGSNASGIETLATKGWTTSVTNILKAGDYIQVGNYMHKVLKNVNSDGSGNCTLDITPPLRATQTDGTSITTTNCVTTCELATNDISWNTDHLGYYSLAFTCIERL